MRWVSLLTLFCMDILKASIKISFINILVLVFPDLYGVAELLVDSLYELDKNLKNLKKEVIKK